MNELTIHLGLFGIAALALWLAAGAGVAAYALRWRSRLLPYTATAVAVCACVAAQWSMSRALYAPLDDRAAQAALAAQEAAQHERIQQRVRSGRIYAEDSAADALDVAGLSAAEAQRLQQQAAAARQARSEAGGYAYRQRGVQQRGGGEPGEALQGIQQIHDDTGAANDDNAVPAGALTYEQKQRAVQLAGVNIGAAWLALLAALTALTLDYLHRIGRPLAPALSLPLDGRWLLALLPRPHRIKSRPGSQQALAAHLRQLVRRGQTFCVFADHDPLEDETVLHRFTLGPCRLGAVPKVLRDGSASQDSTPELDDDALLESLWFGRCCCVVTDPDAQEKLLAQCVAFMQGRRQTRAVAAATLHIVWARAEPMPAEAWTAVMREGATMNVALLAVTDATLPLPPGVTWNEQHDTPLAMPGRV